MDGDALRSTPGPATDHSDVIDGDGNDRLDQLEVSTLQLKPVPPSSANPWNEEGQDKVSSVPTSPEGTTTEEEVTGDDAGSTATPLVTRAGTDRAPTGEGFTEAARPTSSESSFAPPSTPLTHPDPLDPLVFAMSCVPARPRGKSGAGAASRTSSGNIAPPSSELKRPDLIRYRSGLGPKSEQELQREVDGERVDWSGMSVAEAAWRKLAEGDRCAVSMAAGTDVRDVHGKYARPEMSVPDLIRLVIAASPRQAMKLDDIYQAFEHRWAYFRTTRAPDPGRHSAWRQNTVRHTLSDKDCFEIVKDGKKYNDLGKGYWRVRMVGESEAASSSAGRKRKTSTSNVSGGSVVSRPRSNTTMSTATHLSHRTRLSVLHATSPSDRISAAGGVSPDADAPPANKPTPARASIASTPAAASTTGNTASMANTAATGTEVDVEDAIIDGNKAERYAPRTANPPPTYKDYYPSYAPAPTDGARPQLASHAQARGSGCSSTDCTYPSASNFGPASTALDAEPPNDIQASVTVQAHPDPRPARSRLTPTLPSPAPALAHGRTRHDRAQSLAHPLPLPYPAPSHTGPMQTPTPFPTPAPATLLTAASMPGARAGKPQLHHGPRPQPMPCEARTGRTPPDVVSNTRPVRPLPRLHPTDSHAWPYANRTAAMSAPAHSNAVSSGYKHQPQGHARVAVPSDAAGYHDPPRQQRDLAPSMAAVFRAHMAQDAIASAPYSVQPVHGRIRMPMQTPMPGPHPSRKKSAERQLDPRGEGASMGSGQTAGGRVTPSRANGFMGRGHPGCVGVGHASGNGGNGWTLPGIQSLLRGKASTGDPASTGAVTGADTGAGAGARAHARPGGGVAGQALEEPIYLSRKRKRAREP